MASRTLAKVNETLYVHPLDGEVFANVVNMSTGIDVSIILSVIFARGVRSVSLVN